jgi:hypothetical protein
MTENAPGRRRWTSLAKTGGLLAAGALAGAVLVGTIPAVADSGSTSSTDSSPTAEPTPGSGSETQPTPGSEGNRDDCPPSGPGRHRGDLRDMAPNPDDGGTPDQQTPEQTPDQTPQQTPSSGQTSFGLWLT